MSPPYNLDGYRRLAERKLPRPIFDFVDGGTEDEHTMSSNRAAFAALRLQHRVHATRDAVDLRTTLCGQPLSMPVLLAPIGNVGLVHPSGDAAAAAAARAQQLIMLLSANASYTIEETARAGGPGLWYQLYTYGNHDFYGSLIDRAAAAGYAGLVVTVDTPVVSNRERDVANAFSRPPRLTLGNAFEMFSHPRWLYNVLKYRRVVVKVFADAKPAPLLRFASQAKRSGEALAHNLQRVTWDDVVWIRSRWQGPMGVKGIVHPDDARRAVELGAEAIFVSNHGGRQLDTDLATLEALPSILSAVGGEAEVVLDGGIRRGTDVIKALCLGARAVSIGRPWAYALAAGPCGVEAMLGLLRREIEISLELLGVTSVQQLEPGLLATL